MNFSKMMISRKMMTEIWYRKFSQMGEKNFKKDHPALPPPKFFHVYIINHVVFLIQFEINLHL